MSAFLQANNLVSCENLFEPSELSYTYKKGKNTAYIDHAICAANDNHFITGYGILDDADNASDHFPIKVETEFSLIEEPSISIAAKKKKK